MFSQARENSHFLISFIIKNDKILTLFRAHHSLVCVVC